MRSSSDKVVRESILEYKLEKKKKRSRCARSLSFSLLILFFLLLFFFFEGGAGGGGGFLLLLQKKKKK